VAEVSHGITVQQLWDAVPGFIERHWPKNDTAADGGAPTPGRGHATVTVSRFITEFAAEHAP
jgi:hypothetical protein